MYLCWLGIQTRIRSIPEITIIIMIMNHMIESALSGTIWFADQYISSYFFVIIIFFNFIYIFIKTRIFYCFKDRIIGIFTMKQMIAFTFQVTDIIHLLYSLQSWNLLLLHVTIK
jgi:hypothetical protein